MEFRHVGPPNEAIYSAYHNSDSSQLTILSFVYPLCSLRSGKDPRLSPEVFSIVKFTADLGRSIETHSQIQKFTKMPPKKQENAPKKKAATVDDKTFGMKNKKGGKAQQTIKQLEASSKSNKSAEEKKKDALREQKAKDKAAAEAAQKEAAELFKPVQAQKVPFGVDPKTVLCQFFKKGGCEKGKKCKFSHDLDVERKTQKINLYEDSRQTEREEKEKDKIDDWDEEKLRQVVLSKHGNPKTTTDKVCKFFIQAIEDGKYGWFWTCPNGGDKCMYRHSLPPGYVSSCVILSSY